jgi:uncharacterized protein (TIGR03437 family)
MEIRYDVVPMEIETLLLQFKRLLDRFSQNPAASTRSRCVLVLCLIVLSHVAIAQSPDFLHPTQTGPFRYNGISFVELSVTGPQSGYKDPVNLGSSDPVVTIDNMIADIKATGANLVKFTFSSGQVKTYTDNAYDPTIPFPNEGTSANIIAFGKKLTAQGIGCYVQPFAGVANVIAGATNTSTVQPTDPRAFMAQHIPRLVSLAQIAESMGCEFFSLFGDETEQLAVLPTLTDLWIQAITQVRGVFSGRVIPSSAWGEHGGPYTFNHQPEIIGMLDLFGVEFGPAFTNHDDPTVAELAASYTNNSQGHNSLQAVADIHTLYQKAIFLSDQAWGSFKGSNVQSDDVLFGEYPASQFTVDYQEQVNLYQAFYQVMPTLDPQWMLGGTFDSVDRLPYAFKDKLLPPYLGTVGESLMGKPALQTITQVYHTTSPIRAPADGWWYNPATPGTYYVLDAENGVVHLGILSYSATGDPRWSLVRCVQRPTGEYVGTAEQYTGGWALNQAAMPPEGIADGAAVQLVFNSAATATLQIGADSVPIQRYQFSDQWASPMLNAPRTGWWDQTTQSGRGYFLEVQGNTLLIGGLIYGTSGQPSWFTSTGPMDSTGAFAGSLTVCSAQANPDGSLQAPNCEATTDTIRLVFSAQWRATLTLGRESPVDLRRYRQAEIGWAGPAPSFALPNPTFLGQGNIVNPASFATGLSPGSIGKILGSGLTRGVSGIIRASKSSVPYSIQGTSVLVNGLPAPILGIANVNGVESINFQVPWEVQGAPIPPIPMATQPFIVTNDPVASVTVMNNGTASPSWRGPFYVLQPAIFTTDGIHAVAVRPDGSLVTPQSPTRAGDVLKLCGTGFGPVTPQPPTGAPAGMSQMNTMPTFGVNGRSTVPQYAGLTPSAVGLYQFEVVVPDGLASGDLPAAFNVGGQISNIFSIPVEGAAGGQKSGELIKNGGFDPSIGNWFLYLAPNSGAAATLDWSTSIVHDGNYSAHISVTTSGTPGDVVLFQGGLPLVQGATYLLQFWATSSNARTLSFGINGGGQNFLTTSVTIRSGWQFYQIAFQATESATNGQLGFYFGAQAGDTWLDNVSLTTLIAATNP